MKLRIAGTLVLGLAAIAAAEWTEQELKARFYYDLGPAEVDVAGYPDAAKKGYALFRVSCTRCHSAARPLNAAYASREDWTRYVKRMHGKAAAKKGAAISKDDAAAIIEFLTYDSKVRKIDQKAKFEEQTKELQSRFKAVQAAREKSETERALEKARAQDNPGGAHPQPAPDERR